MTPKHIIALVVGVLSPRFLILILWLFTKWFAGVTAGIWQLLGFIFAPYTLLWYSVVERWFNGQWTLGAVLALIVALVIDFTPAKKILSR